MTSLAGKVALVTGFVRGIDRNAPLKPMRPVPWASERRQVVSRYTGFVMTT